MLRGSVCSGHVQAQRAWLWLLTGVAQVAPEALRLLASEAMADIAHLLRPSHLQQLSNILKDPEVSHASLKQSPF